jgi:hypothetical protein
MLATSPKKTAAIAMKGFIRINNNSFSLRYLGEPIYSGVRNKWASICVRSAD